MKDCKFCGNYRSIRKTEEKNDQKLRSDPESPCELRHVLKVALISETQRRKRGTSQFVPSGQIIYGTYSLRHCPICGKKLK